jgi:two-component system response regulator NreC
MPIRIFIVGDDQTCQELKTMLADTTGIEIIGEDCSGSGAFLKLDGESLPDLVIVCLGTPEKDLGQLRKLKQEFSLVKVLLLTAHNQENCLISLLTSGAEGYAARHPLREDLQFAIKKIAAGGMYVDPEFTLDLLAMYKAATNVDTYPAKEDLNITEREMDVLSLVAKGHTNAEMAKQLFTSVRTIETRRKNLLEKTGTTNTATLIRFAILNKLIR